MMESTTLTRAYLSPLGRMRMLGGAPALDLANTLHRRDGALADFIPDYSALLDFCLPAQLLNVEEFKAARRECRKDAGKAARIHGQVVQLRHALKQWLQAAATNLNGSKRSSQAALRRLSSAIAETVGDAEFTVVLGSLHTEPKDAMSLPLWRCAAAITLLTLFAPEGDIRQCEADSCGGYFINQSRSKPRRWCSMDGCGNRAKAARFRKAHGQVAL